MSHRYLAGQRGATSYPWRLSLVDSTTRSHSGVMFFTYAQADCRPAAQARHATTIRGTVSCAWVGWADRHLARVLSHPIITAESENKCLARWLGLQHPHAAGWVLRSPATAPWRPILVPWATCTRCMCMHRRLPAQTRGSWRLHTFTRITAQVARQRLPISIPHLTVRTTQTGTRVGCAATGQRHVTRLSAEFTLPCVCAAPPAALVGEFTFGEPARQPGITWKGRTLQLPGCDCRSMRFFLRQYPRTRASYVWLWVLVVLCSSRSMPRPPKRPPQVVDDGPSSDDDGVDTKKAPAMPTAGMNCTGCAIVLAATLIGIFAVTYVSFEAYKVSIEDSERRIRAFTAQQIAQHFSGACT